MLKLQVNSSMDVHNLSTRVSSRTETGLMCQEAPPCPAPDFLPEDNSCYTSNTKHGLSWALSATEMELCNCAPPVLSGLGSTIFLPALLVQPHCGHVPGTACRRQVYSPARRRPQELPPLMRWVSCGAHLSLSQDVVTPMWSGLHFPDDDGDETSPRVTSSLEERFAYKNNPHAFSIAENVQNVLLTDF